MAREWVVDDNDTENGNQDRGMPSLSAGLLIYRKRCQRLQVLLVHPGGPFFKNKDAGAWSIPKGEVDSSEELLQAAMRESQEELGFVPDGPFVLLSPIEQKGGKVVHAWAVSSDWDPQGFVSNTFTIEWPPRSGRQMQFPEIDQAEFFDIEIAKCKINPRQVPFIEELERIEAA